MIPAREALQAIASRRGDAVAVATTTPLRLWGELSQRRDLDADLSDCMDKASSVGLGLALAQPDRQVMVLDSDTALRSNLAGLATVGGAAPANMVHFLLEDKTRLPTDGMPIGPLDKLGLQGAGARFWLQTSLQLRQPRGAGAHAGGSSTGVRPYLRLAPGSLRRRPPRLPIAPHGGVDGGSTPGSHC